VKLVVRLSIALAALSVLAFHGFEAATYVLDRRRGRAGA
jgi:hypothetical protein